MCTHSSLYRRNLLTYASIIIFTASELFSIFNPATYYFHTMGNINYLMAGALGAIFYTKYPQKYTAGLLNKNWTFYTFLLITLIFQFIDFPGGIGWASKIILSPFLYLYFVVFFTENSDSGKQSTMSDLGKYTYGMYLYHPTIIILAKVVFDKMNLNYTDSLFINMILSSICLVTTITISIFSYEYFEKFFLRLKNKFSLIETRL